MSCIIVRRNSDGELHGSMRPCEHSNATAAITEAERLAGANPGASFEVFVAVSRSTARSVNTDILLPAVDFVCLNNIKQRAA